MRRWQDITLVLLAVGTAVLVWSAFRALDPVPVAATALTSDLGARSPLGARDVPTAAGSSDLATASQAEAPAPATEDPLSRARELLQRRERTVVLVLGDSTSNDRGEWTYRWAEALAATRPTSIAPWNEWTEEGYVEAEVLSDTASALGEVLVLSGSQTGAPAGYAASRLDLLAPEEPDLVILNLGHNNGREDVVEDLRRTLDAVRARAGEDVPVLVTLQQPQAGDQNAPVREAVAGWAQEEGLPTIDVAASFLAQEDPAALLTDAVHPNDAGSALWAEVVAQTLDVP